MFKRNISQRLHGQTKVPVFAQTQPLPLSLYLSPSLSFSLRDADSVEQSERSWLNSLLYLKHSPLFQSNAALFELPRSAACFDACHAGRGTLRDLCVRDFKCRAEANVHWCLPLRPLQSQVLLSAVEAAWLCSSASLAVNTVQVMQNTLTSFAWIRPGRRADMFSDKGAALTTCSLTLIMTLSSFFSKADVFLGILGRDLLSVCHLF